MFDRLSRSWHLVKASWAVLKQDQQLLVFPLISALAALVVVVSFALPLLGLGAIDGLSGRGGSAVSMVTYVVGFLFYVSLYFVIFFFNAALVGPRLLPLDGRGLYETADGRDQKYLSLVKFCPINAEPITCPFCICRLPPA